MKPPFPLRISRNRRYLVGANGKPFPVVGDTAWSLVAQLTESEIAHYLDDRQRRGVNAIIVNLIERKFADNAPATIGGTAPFLAPGDFARPDSDYFAFARRAIEAAGACGISVWLCPAYLGWGGGDEGFWKEIEAAGPAALRAYGRFVGERFKDLANIVWMPGGDFAVPENLRWAGEELAQGLRDGGAAQLMTAHGGQTSATATFGDRPWLGIESVYRYQDDLWRPLQDAWRQRPIRPFVMIESAYEGEHQASPARLRRQMWWPFLCGGCGQFFGNNPIWYFDARGHGFEKSKSAPTWRQALDLPGSRALTPLATFLQTLPWHRLVPDPDGTPVTARTPDGKFAALYLPEDAPRAVGLAGSWTRARWFDPTDGSWHLADPKQPVAPEKNAAGDADWVLALEADGPRKE